MANFAPNAQLGGAPLGFAGCNSPPSQLPPVVERDPMYRRVVPAALLVLLLAGAAACGNKSNEPEVAFTVPPQSAKDKPCVEAKAVSVPTPGSVPGSSVPGSSVPGAAPSTTAAGAPSTTAASTPGSTPAAG